MGLGIVQEDGNECLLCEEGIEDCRHFFFHCSRVYKVWSTLVWGMQYVGAGDATFEVWFLSLVSGQWLVFWRITFIALVWAIWRCWNKISFKGKDSMRMFVLNYAYSIWHGGLKLSEEIWSLWLRIWLDALEIRIFRVRWRKGMGLGLDSTIRWPD